jgi:DNA-directed RNA polymerase subunit N (RpoN/RPB10)
LLGEPLLSAGDISAQMQVRAARGRLASPLANHFRQSYLAASGETEQAMRAFEALALLRYACRRARTHADNLTAMRLLDMARSY